MHDALEAPGVHDALEALVVHDALDAVWHLPSMKSGLPSEGKGQWEWRSVSSSQGEESGMFSSQGEGRNLFSCSRNEGVCLPVWGENVVCPPAKRN